MAMTRGAPEPLAQLWGIPAPTDGIEVGQPGLPPRPTGGVLDLGGPLRLETSGGIRVCLPVQREGRDQLSSLLERWAYAVLSESYATEHPAEAPWMLQAYYRMRPLLPRRIQILLRRVHARRRTGKSWLEWPADGIWVALAEAYLTLAMLDGEGLQPLRLWPEGQSSAVVLTHDVEGLEGQARCREVAALEERFGFRSCFNFVAERYPVDTTLQAELRDRGHELGLHGIKHDGLKFSSREVFEERVESMRRYRDLWKVDGFRSPATHRRWEWMPELPFLYDSSFPDTDPYEPIPGGCASPWPFWLGSLIELPITLPQDHTLWEILKRPALEVWLQKLNWLRGCRGLATILVHPDYLTTPARWAEYQAFLAELAAAKDVWLALPGDVARWWRTRTVREPVSLVRDGMNCRLTYQ